MNFAVYKSSAGSGKTHTLVKEYICLVVENPEKYRNILAITFTNKAANEMKSRILLYLKILGQFPVPVEKPLIKDVLDEISVKTGLSGQNISSNANLVLKLILHNYSNFAVSTIDSFVHRLVRSFARDLRLPVNFEIELDSDKLVAKSIGLLISKVGLDAGLTKALVRFVESKMEDEKSWDIEHQLKNFASALLKEDSFEAIKKLQMLETDDFIRINQKLMDTIKAFESKIQAIAQQAVQLIKNKGLDHSAFHQGNKGISGYFEKLAVKNFEKISPNSFVDATIYDHKWYGGKASISDKKAVDEISEELGTCFTQIQNVVHADFAKYQICKVVIQNIYPIAVLNAIQKVMDEFRENENIVHISEFNKRIAEIVGSEPVPFIYERIGEKYKHFLVDEFQDTSVLQWQNLLPLLENSLGNDNFNMIVGDGKQAIYRWRSGEVEQFAQLPKIYPPTEDPLIKGREALLKSHYKGFSLDTNYRSKAEIVKFNNDFFNFSRQFLDDNFKSIYETVEQKFVESNTGGFVRIEFFNKAEFEKDEILEAELEKIRKIIVEDLAGFEYRDIAVLTRKNDEGSEVARYLLQNGINVVSSEVLTLSSSPEVGFLLAMLSYINDPKEKLPIGIILNYLTRKKKINFNSLNEAFNSCAELSRTDDPGQNRLPLEALIRKNGINFDISSLKPFTLYENVAELVNIFSLDPAYNNPFVQFFMDIILEFTAKFNEGISEFLAFWEDTKHKHSIIVPEGMNAVRIMSIHKAKGLEFPVVIYPFANNMSKLAVDDAWIDLKIEEIPEFKTALIRYSKALEDTDYAQLYLKEKNKSFLDTLNLLYVTMTRPTKGLFIITRDKTNAKGWTEAPMFKDNADLFRGFLIEKGLWKDDQKIYEFGELPLISKKQISNEQKSDKSIDWPANVGNWRKKITISTSAPAVWDVENPNRNREYGNLLHHILSGINTVSDLNRELDEALMEGLLDEQQKAALFGKIGRIIAKPEISKCFEEGVEVKNERDILTPQGKTLRPDRVVFDGKKAVILDYKTGHEQEFHFRQLQDYAGILAEMGYTEVEKFLVYLEDEKVVVC